MYVLLYRSISASESKYVKKVLKDDIYKLQKLSRKI